MAHDFDFDFESAVEDGLRLSKRLYFGKDRTVAPPKTPMEMDRTAAAKSYLPTSLMLYAAIGDPSIVDNPDMPSYQPHVHGRCDPPALIPLNLMEVSLEADCYLDTAFVTMTATWRVHCVMGSRRCDCRVAVPMGEQGSILGVEVEVLKNSYSTQVIGGGNDKGTEKIMKIEDGGFLKPHIFTLKVPQIDGGTKISVKLRWSQKLLYNDGEFTLSIPFNFPGYVTPAGKKMSKREKIQLNVNPGSGTEVLCKTASHPMKERLRQAGRLGFLYDSDVETWSSSDFVFTYSINSTHTFGGVLLSPPSALDVDPRAMFCCYLYPGKQQSEKFFRKEVVFAVDISGSMKGKLLDDTKNALSDALKKLDAEDKFNIIAFNGETCIFSSSLESATAEVIENATQWINSKFVAGGGTNILVPLNQAIAMFSQSRNSIPIIFLITDGAVEDERHICDIMKREFSDQKDVSPRIYTIGIGTFCNHYFLRMLAIIGRGYHDAATDVDSVKVRIGGLFARASSICLANSAFENLDSLDDLEVFPSQIPDLSSESPLIVSGRYRGTFPDVLKIKGILPDMSVFSLDLNVRQAEEIPIAKILAKQEIELLTAHAWYSKNKGLEEKVAKVSVQNSIVSEYTDMVLLETERRKISEDSTNMKQADKVACQKKTEDSKPQTRLLLLQNMRLGFGDISATTENIPPGSGKEPKLPEAAELFVRATSNCCGKLFSHCCCMCCIQTCSRLNDQCVVAFTQLCGALACLGCYACCGGNN